MADRQSVVGGVAGPVYVAETGTFQAIAPVVYVAETPATPATGDTPTAQAVM